MLSCPCGSNKLYQNCCQPIHQDHAQAQLPEQLMRARYSAHALKLSDFVIATYHISCHAENEIESITDSINLDWIRLEVLAAPSPVKATDREIQEGYVEFKAYMQENGHEHCMHERSRFIREGKLWYYVDGVFPDNENDNSSVQSLRKETQKHTSKKIGRNDPCICGSGKKFKKCCG